MSMGKSSPTGNTGTGGPQPSMNQAQQFGQTMPANMYGTTPGTGAFGPTPGGTGGLGPNPGQPTGQGQVQGTALSAPTPSDLYNNYANVVFGGGQPPDSSIQTMDLKYPVDYDFLENMPGPDFGMPTPFPFPDVPIRGGPIMMPMPYQPPGGGGAAAKMRPPAPAPRPQGPLGGAAARRPVVQTPPTYPFKPFGGAQARMNQRTMPPMMVTPLLGQVQPAISSPGRVL